MPHKPLRAALAALLLFLAMFLGIVAAEPPLPGDLIPEQACKADDDRKSEVAEQEAREEPKIPMLPDKLTPLLENASVFMGSLLSVYMGYRLTIARDRRRELNQITDAVAACLDNDRGSQFPEVPRKHVRALNRSAGLILRWRFAQALGRYEQERQHYYSQVDQDPIEGYVEYTGDPAPVRRAATKLLRVCKRR